MNPIAWLLIEVIDIYTLILFCSIIVSLLLHFGVLNRGSKFVNILDFYLTKLTEPVLVKIRKYLPPVGGLDFSPVVLFIVLGFLRQVVIYYLA